MQGADLTQETWRPALAADVLWGLGLAHHWTPRLGEWEALLQRLGGLAALMAREAASVLWAFATLGHAPTVLLQVLLRWRFWTQFLCLFFLGRGFGVTDCVMAAVLDCSANLC